MTDYAIKEDGIIQIIFLNNNEKTVNNVAEQYNRIAKPHKYTVQKVETTIKEID